MGYIALVFLAVVMNLASAGFAILYLLREGLSGLDGASLLPLSLMLFGPVVNILAIYIGSRSWKRLHYRRLTPQEQAKMVNVGG